MMSDHDTAAYEEAEADRERQSAAMADADVAEIVNALLDKGIVEDAGRVLDILSDYRGMANDQLAEALGSQAFADGTEAACLHLEASRRLPAFFKERFRAWDPAAVRQLLDGDLPLADAVCAAAVEVDHENAVAEHRDRTDKAAGLRPAEAEGPVYFISDEIPPHEQRDGFAEVQISDEPGSLSTVVRTTDEDPARAKALAERIVKLLNRKAGSGEGRKYSVQVYFDAGRKTSRSVVFDLTGEQAAKIDEARQGLPLRECWIDEREAEALINTCDDPEEAAGPADFAMEREFERQRRDPDDRYYDEEEVYRDDH